MGEFIYAHHVCCRCEAIIEGTHAKTRFKHIVCDECAKVIDKADKKNTDTFREEQIKKFKHFSDGVRFNGG